MGFKKLLYFCGVLIYRNDMRKYLTHLLTISIFGMLSMTSKADDKKTASALLFDRFEDGYVVMKSNKARVPAKLNYDKIAESMVFIENNITLELDINTVTIVVINERYFIPSGKNFYYERITAGDNEIFVRHKAKVVSKGKAAGYGSYSETSAISGISSFSSTGAYTNIGVDEKFACEDSSDVFLINGKKYERISSLKSLIKLFKSHQATLETYAKDNKTDFAILENVITIVEYAFSL